MRTELRPKVPAGPLTQGLSGALSGAIPLALAGAFALILSVPAGVLAAPLVASSSAIPSPVQDTSSQYAVVAIDAVGPQRLAEIKTQTGVTWWVEVDDSLLVAGDLTALQSLGSKERLQWLDLPAEGQFLLLRTTHRNLSQETDLQILATGGGWAIVHTTVSPAQLNAQIFEKGHVDGCAKHPGAQILQPNTVLARQQANEPPRPRRSFGSGIQTLVDEIDEVRWFSDLTTLSGFNRWTHGSEVLQARDWLVGQFNGLPGITATTTSFSVNSTTAFNVIATLPGSTRTNDWYLVGAHYDSTSQSPSSAAPGAEDNASGCAGVLEMARVLSQYPPEGTVIFLCYSGEEQGLFGSQDHASGLISSGDASKIQEILIMDMIAYTTDSDLDVLLEANSASQGLIQDFADAAAEFTSMRVVTSLNPFGSDHVPYLNRGMTALLVIENDWDQYPGYHSTTDLVSNLDMAMGHEVLKMNIAAIGRLVGATASSSGDVFADGFESGDASAWTSQIGQP